MELEIHKNEIVLGSNNRTMLTDVFYATEKLNCPVVIYIHGFNGFKDWGNFDLIATQFAQAGFFFVKFNFSHNGTTIQLPEDFTDLEAFGNNNYSKELFDIKQIIDWVCNDDNKYQQYIDSNQITLLGHSRGGGIAILASQNEQQRVSSLITWASISECKTPWGNMKQPKLDAWKKEGVMYYSNKRTNQQMPLYYQLYEDYYQNENLLNIKNAIESLTIPILICHGTNDAAVNVSSSFDLKKWKPNAKLFLNDGDHVFDRKHPWTEFDLPKNMQEVVDESLHFLNTSKSIH